MHQAHHQRITINQALLGQLVIGNTASLSDRFKDMIPHPILCSGIRPSTTNRWRLIIMHLAKSHLCLTEILHLKQTITLSCTTTPILVHHIRKACLSTKPTILQRCIWINSSISAHQLQQPVHSCQQSFSVARCSISS